MHDGFGEEKWSELLLILEQRKMENKPFTTMRSLIELRKGHFDQASQQRLHVGASSSGSGLSPQGKASSCLRTKLTVQIKQS